MASIWKCYTFVCLVLEALHNNCQIDHVNDTVYVFNITGLYYDVKKCSISNMTLDTVMTE